MTTKHRHSTTTRHTTYTLEQLAYLNAKRDYNDRNDAAYAILGECLDESDEAIEAYCEREAQVHTELGTLQAWRILRDAEQALLDWGVAQAKTIPTITVEQVHLIERLAQTPLLKYRKRAIDLIMQLDMTTGGRSITQ